MRGPAHSCFIFLSIAVFPTAILSAHRRIYGGREAKIEDFPHMVQIQKKGQVVCGGSIITTSDVLTSAHCVLDYSDLEIVIDTNRIRGGQRSGILVVYIHPGFRSWLDPSDNDVAIIQPTVPGLINFDTINAKSVTLSLTAPQPGQDVTALGFGQISTGVTSSVLLKTVLTTLLWTNCYEKYNRTLLTRNMFCTSPMSKGPCHGDSGGPLMLGSKLAGIIAGGKECRSNKYPIVYFSVLKYKSFIDSRTRGAAQWG